MVGEVGGRLQLVREIHAGGKDKVGKKLGGGRKRGIEKSVNLGKCHVT